MNWLNLEIKKLTSHEFLGSEPTERASWICLLRYCAQQENSGTIENCKDWGERKWMQLVGITKQEADETTQLWTWKNKSLVTWGYPISQECSVKAKREAGKLYGKGKSNSKGNSNSKDELSVSNKLSNSLANSLANTKYSISERLKDKMPAEYKELFLSWLGVYFEIHGKMVEASQEAQYRKLIDIPKRHRIKCLEDAIAGQWKNIRNVVVEDNGGKLSENDELLKHAENMPTQFDDDFVENTPKDMPEIKL